MVEYSDDFKSGYRAAQIRASLICQEVAERGKGNPDFATRFGAEVANTLAVTIYNEPVPGAPTLNEGTEK